MSISISKLQAALPLVEQIDQALDVDGNGQVADDEVKRIGVRDGWVARDFFHDVQVQAGTDDMNPTPSMMTERVSASLRALVKLDQDKDGTLSDAELAKASRIGKLFIDFVEKDGGLSVAEMKIRPYEKPGTPAFAQLARREYSDGLSISTTPFFGSALIVSAKDQPAGVAKVVDALAQGPGKTQCASWLVNGAQTYFVERVDTQSGTGAAAVCDPLGNVLGQGTIKKVSDHQPWRVSWS